MGAAKIKKYMLPWKPASIDLVGFISYGYHNQSTAEVIRLIDGTWFWSVRIHKDRSYPPINYTDGHANSKEEAKQKAEEMFVMEGYRFLDDKFLSFL